MTWNWQQKDWPHFSYDPDAIAALEEQFLHDSGVLFGVFKRQLEKKPPKKGALIHVL